MKKLRKPNEYWTKKRILIQAKKYKSNKKWKQNCHQSFYIAKKMGWITEAQQYLMNAYKLNILSKEEVFTEALKYPNRTLFKKYSKRHFKKASRNKWMIDCCQHMTRKNVWTKINILREIRRHSTRKDMWEKSAAAVHAAKKMGIYKEAISHFPRKKIKSIKNKRKTYMQLTNKELIKLSTQKIGNGMTKHQYSIKNHYLCKILRKRNLWIFFSKRLQSGIKLLGLKNTIWTIETVKKESLKYNTRYQFSKNSRGAYEAARKLKILNKVCQHMVPGKIPKYPKEFLLSEALKYKTKEEFREKARNLYNAAWDRGFYKEATKHMKKIIRNEEEKVYPYFDIIFKKDFKIYKTNRNKKFFGFLPDRIIEKDNIYYIIEIKRDEIKSDSTNQMIKYEKFAKNKFQKQFGGVYLLSKKGNHPRSKSFKEFFLFIKKLHKSIIKRQITTHTKIASWAN